MIHTASYATLIEQEQKSGMAALHIRISPFHDGRSGLKQTLGLKYDLGSDFTHSRSKGGRLYGH
jgi:hypothetical protein